MLQSCYNVKVSFSEMSPDIMLDTKVLSLYLFLWWPGRWFQTFCYRLGYRTCTLLLSSKIFAGFVAWFLGSNTPLIAWYGVCTMVNWIFCGYYSASQNLFHNFLFIVSDHNYYCRLW